MPDDVTTDPATRVVLAVPWYGGSHRTWADGWVRHSRHHIELVTRSAAAWRRRMVFSGAGLGRDVAALVDRQGPPAALIVSSLCDVGAVRLAAGRALDDVPVIAYRHESQFGIADRHGAQDDLAVLSAEWRSLLAADEVWFNSDAHRELVATSVPAWLRAHDEPAEAAEFERHLDASRVVPVGVDLSRIGVDLRPTPPDDRPPLVLFNQRWDRDKAPGRVIAALDAASRAGADFRVALAGEVPPGAADVADGALRRLGDRVVHHGHAEREAYLDLLHRADLVVSDADHEFFGIAPVEAIAAGARPIYPRRHNYPALVGDDPRYLHEGHDLVPRLLEALSEPRGVDTELATSVRRFDWRAVAPLMDDLVSGPTADRRPSAPRS